MEEKDHRFLKASGKIFDLLGWIALVVGTVVTLMVLLGGGRPEAPRIAGIAGIFLGGVYFLIFRTIACVVRLLLELESRIKP
ncbi:MAG: hypothetical protein ABH845_04460 [Candidatus Omnitrophota bacterium]